MTGIRHPAFWPAFLLLMAILAGCWPVGPDYRRPRPDFDIPESYQQGGGAKDTPAISGQWWEDFGDSELDRLVNEALQRNLDLEQATARILEAGAGFVAVRADRFPTIGVQGEAVRQSVTPQLTTSLSKLLKPSAQESNSFNVMAAASFEVDLWGRLARADEAARATLLQSEESRRVVAQTVAAETVNAYLDIEALERRLAITENTIENYRRNLRLIEFRYDHGLTTILTLKQAQRALAQAEANRPAILQDLGLAQQRLAVLLGRYPKTAPARKQSADYFKQMTEVPAGLPSELLLRRPDIRAAEAALRAKNAQVGEALAGRFPKISLTGGFGYQSDDIQMLFKPESEIWNLAFNLTAPIFYAGKLKASQRAAEARYRQAAAEYAKTVLNAFAEVEGALLRRREQLERRERLLVFLKEARATQELAENRYERGLSGYLNVLEAQQSRFVAEETVVLVELAILKNRVALYRALGGGWAEPKPVDLDTRPLDFDLPQPESEPDRYWMEQ